MEPVVVEVSMQKIQEYADRTDDDSGDGESPEGYNVDEALEKIGFGRYQLQMIFVLGFFGVADAVEIMLLSVLSPVLRCEWGLTEVDVATLSTVVFAGMLGFGSVWGKMADKYGRWPTLWTVQFLLGWFGVLSAFSPTYYWLLFLRMMVGACVVGTGQSSVLFAEMLPVKHRGTILVLNHLFWALGSFILVAAAAVIIPNFGWRWLMVLTAVLAWISLAFFKMVPESPRYLLSVGKYDRALGVLEKIAKTNKTMLPAGKLLQTAIQEHGKIKDMFSGPYRRLTIHLFIVWFGMTFGYYGVVLGSTEIVERTQMCDLSGNVVGGDEPHSANLEECECRPLSTEDYVTIMIGTLGEFGSIAINLLLMDRIGRKWTFVVNLVGCAGFVLLMNICTTRYMLSFFILCSRMFMTAVGNVVFVYTSEVYPTTFRAVGLGTCNSFSRIGSMISPFVAQVLLAKSIPAALGVYATVLLLTAINCIFLPIETKGRRLQETGVFHDTVKKLY